MSNKASQPKNRTGVDSHPYELAEMLAAVTVSPPTSVGTRFAADSARIAYARSVGSASLGYGSVPGFEPALLFDKLGERLAFERIGVRLYGMLIAKLEAFGGFEGGPTREQLLRLLNEEHGHLSLLGDAIARLGGDPTAVTPAADLVGVVARGVIAVLSDPRTTLVPCLEVMLVAELADNAGWTALSGIAREAGHREVAESFAEAERTERQHRAILERWIAAAQGRESV